MNLQAELPTSLSDSDKPNASLLRRMSCWLYEGMLLFGVIFIAGYLFGTLSQTKNAMNNRHGLQAFVFLVLALYFTFFLAQRANTGHENLALENHFPRRNGLVSKASFIALCFCLGLVCAALGNGGALGWF